MSTTTEDYTEEKMSITGEPRTLYVDFDGEVADMVEYWLKEVMDMTLEEYICSEFLGEEGMLDAEEGKRLAEEYMHNPRSLKAVLPSYIADAVERKLKETNNTLEEHLSFSAYRSLKRIKEVL